MNPRTRFLLAAALCLIVTQACNAQIVAIGEGSGSGVGFGAWQMIGPGPATPAFSLEEESETTQTLADGTRIEGPQAIRREYHDSQGRSRYEMYVSSPGQPWPGVQVMFSIIDPVAGYNYTLYSGEHKAYAASTQPQAQPVETVLQARTVEPPPSAPPSPATGPAEQLQPKTVFEDLGTSTMQGVQVQGQRTTTTYPVGSIGNDRPFTATVEQWVSPQYGVIMLLKQDDPRSGVSIRRVTEFSADEPDASLFVVPADYDIVIQR